MFRRMLLIAKIMEDTGGSLVLEFENGVVTLNHEGSGSKITLKESEVILSE